MIFNNKKFTFTDIKIPKNATLHFSKSRKYKHNYTCKVKSKNSVIYNNTEMSLKNATVEVIKNKKFNKKTADVYKSWLYKNESLYHRILRILEKTNKIEEHRQKRLKKFKELKIPPNSILILSPKRNKKKPITCKLIKDDIVEFRNKQMTIYHLGKYIIEKQLHTLKKTTTLSVLHWTYKKELLRDRQKRLLKEQRSNNA